MGTWDWNDVDHTIGAIEGSAPTALLAASIIPNQKLDDDYEKSVAIKTGLEQLSLIEWSVSDMVPDLFALLRGKGSSHGYVVEQVAAYRPSREFRRIGLDDNTANAIFRDSAMDMPMAFVDELQLCALASFHSDYALICLSKELFEQWLKDKPLGLTLWSSDEPWPPATNLADARALAARRRKEWDSYISTR